MYLNISTNFIVIIDCFFIKCYYFYMEEYKILYPQYKRCIVNISASILNYFGVNCEFKPLDELKQILDVGQYKKVVLLILDGLGSYNITNCLGENCFLNHNKLTDVTSVFPPTTVAATTSLLSAKMPNQHCWLGWSMYYKDINKCVDVFSNNISGKKLKASKTHKTSTMFPYKNIVDMIKENGIKSEMLTPFCEGDNNINNISSIIDRLSVLLKQDTRQFIYAYCEEPDITFHLNGVSSPKAKDKVMYIQSELIRLSEIIDNETIVIISADHGLVDINHTLLFNKIKGLKQCLSAPPSIEPSAISFRIKADKKNDFLKIFKENIKGYILFSQQELIDNKLFGEGENHPSFKHFIGDYLAVAVSDSVIWHQKKIKIFKGIHAGLRHGEMLCPVITLKKQ